MDFTKAFFTASLIYAVNIQMNTLTEAGLLPLTTLPANAVQPDNLNLTSNTIASPTIAHRFPGYIEYKPNGTIILRSSSFENSTNLQNLLLFKAIMKAIKLTQPFTADPTQLGGFGTNFNIKLYGDGVEHRFPPFLERIIQRIQTYFSVYRYSDTSRPTAHPTAHPAESTSVNAAPTAPTEDIDLTSTLIGIDPGSNTSGIQNLIDDFENTTTTFIDADGGGNEDYPEFIEIRD